VKQLTVLSGKGGTGKTTVVGALATLAKDKVLADCDVDAADLFLILEPTIRHREDFYSGRQPVVDRNGCTQCGVCTELCRYDAINDGAVDLLNCEGCGLCAEACPEHVITMRPGRSGEWFISETRHGTMVHARLGIGEENSGKLVADVRRHAHAVAEEQFAELVIIDGPPGIGCPVISSLTGTDLVLIVTEPTVAGIHDLERIAGLAGHFSIPCLVCVNKYDLNESKTREIEAYCRREGLAVAGTIPFDVCAVEAMVQQKTVMEYTCPAVQKAMASIWREIGHALRAKEAAA